MTRARPITEADRARLDLGAGLPDLSTLHGVSITTTLDGVPATEAPGPYAVDTDNGAPATLYVPVGAPGQKPIPFL